jgi:hypothetical protein
MTDQDTDLEKIDPELASLIAQPDKTDQLIETLRRNYPPAKAAGGIGMQAWDYSGLALRSGRRVHEALAVHWAHYQHLLDGQEGGSRIHKGTPLVRISDCFAALGYRVHARRYLMLTLCEDAIQEKGKKISPQTTGVYFRLILGGVTDHQLQAYASRLYELANKMPNEALFPEALLLQLDDDWLTELPSEAEALFYRANPKYVQHLLSNLGDPSGKTLELLAQYLMSCMAGCRTRTRLRSRSTDYDVVCAMEGFDLDFRSELGRHFVCECKDWNKPADFSVMAKFCRVLDGTKSRFGILFSSEGITGAGKTTDAEREQLKLFLDREIVIVVLNREDLQKVANGMNLITLLRNKYETVRLDLRAKS